MASWYSLPTPTPDEDPIREDEASEPEEVQEEEEGVCTLDESSISFRLSGPYERLSRDDQSDEEPGNSGDSASHSPRKELRRRFTHKEKGKNKMPEYDTGSEGSDWSESGQEGPQTGVRTKRKDRVVEE
mgnify:CR=1 FL=1